MENNTLDFWPRDLFKFGGNFVNDGKHYFGFLPKALLKFVVKRVSDGKHYVRFLPRVAYVYV